jgi:hypothetical protein
MISFARFQFQNTRLYLLGFDPFPRLVQNVVSTTRFHPAHAFMPISTPAFFELRSCSPEQSWGGCRLLKPAR